MTIFLVPGQLKYKNMWQTLRVVAVSLVCMYVCMHSCTYGNTYTQFRRCHCGVNHTFMRVYIYMCNMYVISFFSSTYLQQCDMEGRVMNLYTHMYVCIHTYSHTILCTYAERLSVLSLRLHGYKTAYIHTYIHTCIHTYIRDIMRVNKVISHPWLRSIDCLRVCTCSMYIYIYIYIY